MFYLQLNERERADRVERAERERTAERERAVERERATERERADRMEREMRFSVFVVACVAAASVACAVALNAGGRRAV